MYWKAPIMKAHAARRACKLNHHDNVAFTDAATLQQPWLSDMRIASVSHSCSALPFEVAPAAMTITITPAASDRMRHFLASTPTAAGVRFGVKRTGCSGFAYVVDLAETLDEGDKTVDVDGLPLIVNDKSLALVEGTVIDFQRQGLNASFVFHNPNATGECGCGESFTVG